MFTCHLVGRTCLLVPQCGLITTQTRLRKLEHIANNKRQIIYTGRGKPVIQPRRQAARKPARILYRAAVARPIQQAAYTVVPVPKARTTNSVQTMLAAPAAMQRMKISQPTTDLSYLRCRLDPWNSSGGMIPDKSTARRIMVDHRSYCDITPLTVSGADFVFRTLPSLPYFGVFKNLGQAGAGVFNLNGVTNPVLSPGNASGNWIPCMESSEYYPYNFGIQAGGITNNPFQASKFRIVTQAVRVLYTGTANNASGLITTRSVPLTNTAPAVLTSAFTYNGINWVSGSPTSVAITPATGTPSVNITWPLSFGTVTSESTQCRPEVGCSAIVRHNASEHRWMDYIDDLTIFPVDVDQSSGALKPFMAFGGTGYSPTTQNGGIVGIDADWDSVEFEFRGIAPGTNFRIEMITCVEYEVISTSAFAKLAMKAPQPSPRTLDIADAVLREAPISFPTAKSTSLFNVALQAISKIAPLGAMLGPYGAIAGTALSGISAGLSALNL